MRLLRSEFNPADLCLPLWEELAETIRQNKGDLGNLGGGNHFLDALVPIDGGPLHFPVHKGSRNESGLVDDLVSQPSRFDQEFCRIVQWAAQPHIVSRFRAGAWNKNSTRHEQRHVGLPTHATRVPDHHLASSGICHVSPEDFFC